MIKNIKMIALLPYGCDPILIGIGYTPEYPCFNLHGEMISKIELEDNIITFYEGEYPISSISGVPFTIYY